ncbi:MAG: deoxyribodipyrimidine photo-lyase [Ignavibacteriaceae bacterium]|nr:deoxyribodipyrimidine photo-lyase [Ignavibacteriaceae bacterium]
MNTKRVRILNKGENKIGRIVYWMSRDQRVNDNWALIYSRLLASKNQKGLTVVFTLADNFLGATLRQYDFMFEGLKEVQVKLAELNIPFKLLIGNPAQSIIDFVNRNNISALVTDFDPLKVKRVWKDDVLKNISIPFYEVDAHNVVPAFYVSNKEEFAAYTIRPKIHKLLPEFLDDFPQIDYVEENKPSDFSEIDWERVFSSLKVDTSVQRVKEFIPGENSAASILKSFLHNKLSNYDSDRNNPTLNGQSNLSPYLHFGQTSAQRIALETKKNFSNSLGAESFLEELIVRKELADNFCLYNDNYDNYEGFKNWAKESLSKHLTDKRDYLYPQEKFENAETHDNLWNAAQIELLTIGKMHGYMRMYWAKKILEWSESPSEAMKIAVYLNDKYELDGRDPNGYTGCAWSIGGVHDRAWFERSVYGKIRYMNYNGCKKKFDVEGYIKKQIQY